MKTFLKFKCLNFGLEGRHQGKKNIFSLPLSRLVGSGYREGFYIFQVYLQFCASSLLECYGKAYGKLVLSKTILKDDFVKSC